jgi:hypothetical protein
VKSLGIKKFQEGQQTAVQSSGAHHRNGNPNLTKEKKSMSDSTKAVLERDAVKVDPKHYKVELENDRVRVVRIKYGGKERSVMHQHRPGVVVFLTDAQCKFSYPDGKAEDIQAKAGEFLWFGEAWEHNSENLSDPGLEVIYVELKSC